MKTITFYFDFGSPASYLASKQLPLIADQTGAKLEWHPMLLGGVFRATGNRAPAEVPAKGSYMFKDLTRCAKRYGAPLAMNPFFPINTLQMMRAATGVQMREPSKFLPFVETIFSGMWEKGLNLGDEAVLRTTLEGAGLDAAAILAMTADAEVKDQLKTTTEVAVARGVFGAPTMFVGDEMFFGQDRLDFVREELAR